jgi:maltose/moltooligosaccharide transporter
MDASINVSMEPFRALLAIIFRKTTYHGICHAKFFIGIGAYCIKTTVNFTISELKYSSSWYYSDSVKYSFYFGIAFIVTLWTVITSKEYSPEELEALKTQRNYFHKRKHSADWFASNGKSHLLKGIYSIVSALFSFVIYHFDLKKDLYVYHLDLLVGGLAMLVS